MIKIKINSKLKEGREAPNLNYGVHLEEDGNDFALYLVDLDSMIEQIQKFKEESVIKDKISPEAFFSEYISELEGPEYDNPSVIGFIEVKDPNENDLPCMKALDVNYTAIHEKREGQGIAKLMYQLAMANSAKKRRPLMPDRLHVEPAAENIWNSFARNSDVIKTFDSKGRPTSKTDDIHDEEYASYFDIDIPKLTKMKMDDCPPSSEKPYKHNLNRAYYSDKMLPKLQAYVNNFKMFATRNFTSLGTLGDALYDASHSIFRRRF